MHDQMKLSLDRKISVNNTQILNLNLSRARTDLISLGIKGDLEFIEPQSPKKAGS